MSKLTDYMNYSIEEHLDKVVSSREAVTMIEASPHPILSSERG